MYALYRRTRIGNTATRYELDKDEPNISLFGRNSGFIPWLLRFKVPVKQNEPYRWHINVLAELDAQPDYRRGTLVIDLKPKQNKDSIYLFEVRDVWGWSQDGWTPILLRLDGLFVDENSEKIDRKRKKFVRDDADIDRSIYEFLYLTGSIKNGELEGKWVAPPMSSTNAPLLWPETLNYFVQCIRERTPDVLASAFDINSAPPS